MQAPKKYISKQTLAKLLLTCCLACLFGTSVQAQLTLSALQGSNQVCAPAQPPSLQSVFVSTPMPGLAVPKAYSYQHLAFFCKMEVQLEQSFQLPVKLRLGSVDYVNWLEQKNPFLRYVP